MILWSNKKNVFGTDLSSVLCWVLHIWYDSGPLVILWKNSMDSVNSVISRYGCHGHHTLQGSFLYIQEGDQRVSPCFCLRIFGGGGPSPQIYPSFYQREGIEKWIIQVPSCPWKSPGFGDEPENGKQEKCWPLAAGHCPCPLCLGHVHPLGLYRSNNRKLNSRCNFIGLYYILQGNAKGKNSYF